MAIWTERWSTGDGQWIGASFNRYIWNGHIFWPSYEAQGYNNNYPWSIGNTGTVNSKSSFDLTDFQVGNEAVFSHAAIRFNESTYAYWTMTWYDNLGNILYEDSYYVSQSVDPGWEWEYLFGSGIGVRPEPWPEIYYNGQYSIRSRISSLDQTKRYYITNLDTDVLTRYIGKEGHMWVEGNNLWYISEIGCKQKLLSQSTTGFVDESKAGHVWIDGSESRICWVGSISTFGKVPVFESKLADVYWSEGWDTGGPVNVGSSNAGFIWVDSWQWTILQFIDYAGRKCRIGPGYVYSGDYQ